MSEPSEKTQPVPPLSYEQLRAFFVYFVEHYVASEGMKPEHHPVRVLEEMEALSSRKAAKGVHMAVTDFLEMTARWKPEEVCKLDLDLIALNIVTLSELRRRFSKRYAAILKRGAIRSEEEFFLVKGIVAVARPEPAEAAHLDKMLVEYEQRQVAKPPRRRGR